MGKNHEYEVLIVLEAVLFKIKVKIVHFYIYANSAVCVECVADDSRKGETITIDTKTDVEETLGARSENEGQATKS